MSRARAMAWGAAALVLAGCGGGARHRVAAAPAAHRACVRVPARFSAPGPYRVRTASLALSRRSAATGQTRRLDPVAWFPADAPSGCRFAVVLFSPGHAGHATDYSLLLSHLASEGLIVIGPHHPDLVARGDEAAERVADMRFLLARLPALADRLAPGLARHMDSSRVAVAGHSFGAFTAAQLAATDPRLRAAIVMAGGTRSGAAGSTRVPVLAMSGLADRAIPSPIVERYVARLPDHTPHALVLIAGGTHGAYGNGCAHAQRTCAIVQSYATSFLMTYLDGLTGALAPFRSRDPRVTLRTVDWPA